MSRPEKLLVSKNIWRTNRVKSEKLSEASSGFQTMYYWMSNKFPLTNFAVESSFYKYVLSNILC